ncbi:MAG: hypothetical protein IT244_02775, partial [Bacteroidia bacterium]|nr:hypothetical protein [Bacteroidia bacterium]
MASIFTGLAIACALFIVVRTKLPFWSLKSPWMWMAIFVVWQCIASLLVPEMEGLREKLTLRLPLLFLPLLTIIKPDKRLWPYLLLLLSMPLVWISLASIANYFNHLQFYNQMIVESKPLPLFSLVYHIEYSLIQSCTALVLLLFLRKEWKAQPHSMLMVALAVCGVVLFAALHILSARTGILAFWLGLAAAVIFNRERQIKRWKLITAAILVVALAFA